MRKGKKGGNITTSNANNYFPTHSTNNQFTWRSLITDMKVRKEYKKDFIKITIFFFVAFILSSYALLWSTVFSDLPEVPLDIERTMEFQIKLDPKEWEDRDKLYKEFYKKFSQVTGLPIDIEKDLEIHHRIQKYVYITNCTSTDTWIRVRDYFGGPKVNTNTIDAKKNVGNSVKFGENFPLSPNLKYFNSSNQKIEKDVHPCKEKYSRETRIYNIENIHGLKTCGDIYYYFPDIFSKNVNEKEVNYSSDEFWLVISYQTNLNNSSHYKFKSEITIRYENETGVLFGGFPPKRGEFSYRIWSTYEGHGPFDTKFVDQAREWYSTLLQHFGSYQDLPCSIFDIFN